MKPFRFGPLHRQLHGIWHPAEGTSGPIVVISAPLGQEGVRVHRLFHLLAERLARNGCGVLRFDGYGSGDSGGDELEADLTGWAQDLLVASDEARRRGSRGARLLWLGARLGATVALQAASSTQPDGLVLWEPIIDGPAYLDELEASHFRALRAMLNPLPERYLQRQDGEVMGFAMSPTLIEQIRRLAPAPLLPAPTGPARLLHGSDNASLSALGRAWASANPACQPLVLDVAFDWLNEEAMNTALVPAPALEALGRAVGELAGDGA